MKCVNLSILLLSYLAFSTGCTSTTIQYGTFKLHRISFAQSLDVVVTKQGDDFVVKYGNDGGKETSKAIAEGVVAGATLIK